MLAPVIPLTAPGSAANYDHLLEAYQDWSRATFAASADESSAALAIEEQRAIIVMIQLALPMRLSLREPVIPQIEAMLDGYLRCTGRAA